MRGQLQTETQTLQHVATVGTDQRNVDNALTTQHRELAAEQADAFDLDQTFRSIQSLGMQAGTFINGQYHGLHFPIDLQLAIVAHASVRPCRRTLHAPDATSVLSKSAFCGVWLRCCHPMQWPAQLNPVGR